MIEIKIGPDTFKLLVQGKRIICPATSDWEDISISLEPMDYRQMVAEIVRNMPDVTYVSSADLDVRDQHGHTQRLDPLPRDRKTS